MSNPANELLVRTFLGGMGPTFEAFVKTYDEMFHEDVVWESVGGTPHIGRKVCVEHLHELHAAMGMEYCTIDILNIASAGDVVLTERVDRMHRADGTLMFDFAFRIMGTFVIQDDKIIRYTDYYDSLGFGKVAGRG